MLDFPQSTYFGRKIPKEKFYAHLEPSNMFRQRFISEIESIVWRNKLSPGTLNVAEGKYVVEIDLLEILLKQRPDDDRLLEFIDRNLPHHLIFLLLYGGAARTVVHYKEKATNGDFSILETFQTKWTDYRKLSLAVSGLNMDEVYENFIRQAAGKRFTQCGEFMAESGLKAQIVRMQERKKLERQIHALEVKIRNEKQFNLQVRMNEELRKLKKQLK